MDEEKIKAADEISDTDLESAAGGQKNPNESNSLLSEWDRLPPDEKIRRMLEQRGK